MRWTRVSVVLAVLVAVTTLGETSWNEVAVVDVDDADPAEPRTTALPTSRAGGVSTWRIAAENEHGRGPASQEALPDDPAEKDASTPRSS